MNALSARSAVAVYEQIDRLLAKVGQVEQYRGTAKLRGLQIASPRPGDLYGSTFDIVNSEGMGPEVAAKIARFAIDTQLAALRLNLKECGRTLAQLGFEKPKACE